MGNYEYDPKTNTGTLSVTKYELSDLVDTGILTKEEAVDIIHMFLAEGDFTVETVTDLIRMELLTTDEGKYIYRKTKFKLMEEEIE